MAQAKWENIKASACKIANTFVIGPTGYAFPAEAILDAIAERRHLWESVDALRAATRARIMGWDVRCAPTLRDLFPNAFPPALRAGPLTVFMDERGDWCVAAETKLGKEN
jgi:hypothetical protein